MTTNQFIKEVRDHIAKNNMSAAVEQLQQLLGKSPKLDEAILQSARFHRIREQIRTGTVTHEDATVTENQITAGLLEFVSEIEKQGAQPALQQEFEQAVFHIAGSKNVVAGSTINAQNVHIGDIIMTGKGDTPKYDFNIKLTRTLVEAMRTHHEKAEKLCQDFSWLGHPDNRRKVQQFVFQNFVGEIGKQLRKLVNIGDNADMDEAKKQKHYVDKCLDIAKRCLDLVNFTLLSVWWDTVKTAPRTLEAGQEEVLTDFFEKHLEHDLEAQFRLLLTLIDIFGKHDVHLPFEELIALVYELQINSSLHNACSRLESAVKAVDCGVSEDTLAEILRHFAFLTNYRMASIKRIGFRQIRKGEPAYLHRYVALGIDVKYSEDAEKGKWIAFGEQTPAILLYRGDDYREGINLFPFVIDYNALTFEQGAKICFFSAKDLGNDGALEYRFLSDNSIVRIEKQGIQETVTNLDELMMNPENLKQLNLDCVVNNFHDARQAMTSGDAGFFDNL